MTTIRKFLQKNIDDIQALARATRVYVPDGREDLLLVAVDGDALRGFAAWQCVLDEASLLAIAVAADARRQGIAARLLQASEAQLPETKAFFLEVRAGNVAAQALYRRLGFVESGRRRGYYGDEDALLMQKQRV